jgi:hypothetical protein
VVVQDILISAPQPEPPLMNRPPLPSDLYDRLKDDIHHRGVQIPILVDSKTGEVIDGKLRKQIAAELGINHIPTIFVGRLTPEERADLRLAVNIYRRHLTRAQMRELVAWMLRSDPEASDRCIAGRTGASHPAVARVRRGLEAGGTIYHLPGRNGQDGKKYPAAKPAVFACSASEGRRARALLDRMTSNVIPTPGSPPGSLPGGQCLRRRHRLARQRQDLQCLSAALERGDVLRRGADRSQIDNLRSLPGLGHDGLRLCPAGR